MCSSGKKLRFSQNGINHVVIMYEALIRIKQEGEKRRDSQHVRYRDEGRGGGGGGVKNQ